MLAIATSMQATLIWPIPRWLSIVLLTFAIVVAILFALIQAELSVGPNRFSSSSLSIRSARFRRVFVKKAEVKQDLTNDADRRYPIKEAWIEYVNERYDRIPVFKRRTGVRLCVSFDDPSCEFDGLFGEIGETTPIAKIQDKTKFSSGNLVVFSFWAQEEDEFPKKGVFMIRNRDLRYREKVLATFAFDVRED